MAPEVQAHRKATAHSDIFSLHVVMWEVRAIGRKEWTPSVAKRFLLLQD
ncbi:unnamed protein product, partial [Hapterophycus canaliculatus]